MRRREFIVTFGASAVCPRAALSQPKVIRRIGSMASIAEEDPVAQARLSAFRKGLATLGWIEGRNIEIVYRYAAGSLQRMTTNAAELSALNPEVILVNGAPALAALVHQTRSIPIVFVAVSDPVGDGFVSTMARPGGNVTGFTDYESTTSGKWLQLLKDVAPDFVRVLIISTPGNPSTPRRLKAIEDAALQYGIQTNSLLVSDTGEIRNADNSTTYKETSASGLLVLPSPFTPNQRDQLIKFSNSSKMPAVFPFRYFVTGGGLMSYGVDVVDQYQQAAAYVDRILKGESPSNLPVQEPTKYELVINLKTAKALEVKIPAPLLARADEVIE